jgi:ATP-dependent Clp protease adaptor protein ClpS
MDTSRISSFSGFGGAVAPGGGAKKTRQRRVFQAWSRQSDTRDVRSLFTLWTLRDIECHLFALFEGLESAHGYRRKMREEIFTAIIRGDKPETFGVIEPLNSTRCHIATSFKKTKTGPSPTACLADKCRKIQTWRLCTLVLSDASSIFLRHSSILCGFWAKSHHIALVPPRLDTIKAMTRPYRHEDSVLEAQRSKLAPPPLYTVLLLNDDFTPMDFVVHVLQRFFSMDHEQATRTMFKVHTEGRGVCGIYPRDVATTKVEQVSALAREYQHPLMCVMEEN